MSGTLAGAGSAARLIQCEGCGHCVDLRAPAADDAPELVAARAAVQQRLAQWLQAPTDSLDGEGGALSAERWLGATPLGDAGLLATMTSAMQQSGMLEAQPPPVQTG